jgi:antitoxin VapB
MATTGACVVTQTTKTFATGRNQAVRLPHEYRPDSWEGFFALDATTDVPADFMSEAERKQGEHVRDPFESVAV